MRASSNSKNPWRVQDGYKKYGGKEGKACRSCAHGKTVKNVTKCSAHDNERVSFFGVCDSFEAAA